MFYFAKVMWDTRQRLLAEGSTESATVAIRRSPQLPLPPPAKLVITHIIMHGVPRFAGGCRPFFQVMKAPMTARPDEILHNTAWETPVLPVYRADDGAVLMKVWLVVTSCHM